MNCALRLNAAALKIEARGAFEFAYLDLNAVSSGPHALAPERAGRLGISKSAMIKSVEQ
jgi:hypothetical protein